MRWIVLLATLAASLHAGDAHAAVSKVVDGRVDDWTGTSPLIAGVSVMSDGEFVHQDHLYDDTGGWIGVRAAGGRGFANPYGTYRYPSDNDRYAANAADIFQFRAALDGDRVHFLVWLNTLLQPDSTVAAIAIGDDGTEPHAWPHSANLSTPGTRHVLTLWGTGGTVDGEPSADLEVAVSTDDNAIEASVPASLVGTRFRAYVASGLWDPALGEWKTLGAARTATSASGGNANAPRTFNVAFRSDEASYTAGTGWQGLNFWFDCGQATALQAGDISRYFADIDLTAPDTPPPTPDGWQQRFYRSGVTIGEGEGFIETGVRGQNESPVDGGRGRGCSLTTRIPSCTAFSYAGAWQPYLVYVPSSGVERVTLLLHGGGYPHNFTGMPGIRRDLGEGMRALLVEPYGRGTAGWWTDEAHLDALDALQDAFARHPEADRSRTTIGGISMGGYGTNRLLATNPDLFAGGILWSAAPGDIGHEYGGSSYLDPLGSGNGNPNELLPNNANHALVINHGMADDAARYPVIVADTVARLEQLGLAYELWSHPAWQHTTSFDHDDWSREVAVLEPLRITDPPSVTFTMSETFWSEHLTFDRAYWVSGLRVRDTSGGYRSMGTLRARTSGIAATDDRTEAIEPSVSTGPPDLYLRTGRKLVRGERIAERNAFEATLENVSRVRFDLARMGLVRGGLEATITTDGPVTVYLDDEPVVIATAGTHTF